MSELTYIHCGGFVLFFVFCFIVVQHFVGYVVIVVLLFLLNPVCFVGGDVAWQNIPG